MNSSRYVLRGPDGYLKDLAFQGEIHWGQRHEAWRFLTRERVGIVLYELGLANSPLYHIDEVVI